MILDRMFCTRFYEALCFEHFSLLNICYFVFLLFLWVLVSCSKVGAWGLVLEPLSYAQCQESNPCIPHSEPLSNNLEPETLFLKGDRWKVGVLRPRVLSLGSYDPLALLGSWCPYWLWAALYCQHYTYPSDPPLPVWAFPECLIASHSSPQKWPSYFWSFNSFHCSVLRVFLQWKSFLHFPFSIYISLSGRWQEMEWKYRCFKVVHVVKLLFGKIVFN